MLAKLSKAKWVAHTRWVVPRIGRKATSRGPVPMFLVTILDVQVWKEIPYETKLGDPYHNDGNDDPKKSNGTSKDLHNQNL